MFRRRLQRLCGREIVVRGGTLALSPGEGGSSSLAMPVSSHAQFRTRRKDREMPQRASMDRWGADTFSNQKKAQVSTWAFRRVRYAYRL
jgi:hypothetical protein